MEDLHWAKGDSKMWAFRCDLYAPERTHCFIPEFADVNEYTKAYAESALKCVLQEDGVGPEIVC